MSTVINNNKIATPFANDAPALIDRFGREITYLRISVTDRCDLRCIYCMSENMNFVPRDNLLSLEEIVRIGAAFVNMGVSKIRITGGEPLVRKNVMYVFEHLGSLPGLKDLTLTSNGTQLSRYANALHEILELVEFARKKGIDISFIEEMPLGIIQEHDRAYTYYSSDEILNDLRQHYVLTATEESTGGPSRYYRMNDSSTRIGFISPHSHNFCSSCNRVRLTAEGRLLLCLGQEHSVDLRRIVRNHGSSDETLSQAIISAMTIKPKGHDFDLATQPVIFRHMNHTGG
ncbi:MAG: GTP 3',8-cyclase MoaA [Gammaproteobacteria bacterium]